MRNLYDILNVNCSAKLSEIKKAYYSKAKQHHPDLKMGEDDGVMRELNIAYYILSDPERRRIYDETNNFKLEAETDETSSFSEQFGFWGKDVDGRDVFIIAPDYEQMLKNADRMFQDLIKDLESMAPPKRKWRDHRYFEWVEQRSFLILIIFSIIVFSVLAAIGINILEYVLRKYGIYIFCGFLLVATTLQGIYSWIGVGSRVYNVKEFPLLIWAFPLFMIVFPLLGKNGYPSINTDGGLIYYALLALPFILLIGDIILWLKNSIGHKKS